MICRKINCLLIQYMQAKVETHQELLKCTGRPIQHTLTRIMNNARPYHMHVAETGSKDPKKQQPTDLSPGRKRRQRQKHEAEVRPVEKHSWFRRPDKKTRTLTHTRRFFQTGELTLEPCRQWYESPNPCPDFHFFGTF